MSYNYNKFYIYKDKGVKANKKRSWSDIMKDKLEDRKKMYVAMRPSIILINTIFINI